VSPPSHTSFSLFSLSCLCLVTESGVKKTGKKKEKKEKKKKKRNGDRKDVNRQKVNERHRNETHSMIVTKGLSLKQKKIKKVWSTFFFPMCDLQNLQCTVALCVQMCGKCSHGEDTEKLSPFFFFFTAFATLDTRFPGAIRCLNLSSNRRLRSLLWPR
jgi:hypothetical protein